MSIYSSLSELGSKFIPRHFLMKHGFNLSPMYRRSTGRLIDVSEDLQLIKIKIPLSWKNRNYVNSIFGGSMFSAVDPIYMVQLINILGDEYVVWDKSAEIFFKRPAKEHLYGEFHFSDNELNDIKERIKTEKEFDLDKYVKLTNKEGDIIFCEINKKLYVADKDFYKEKRKKKSGK